MSARFQDAPNLCGPFGAPIQIQSSILPVRKFRTNTELYGGEVTRDQGVGQALMHSGNASCKRRSTASCRNVRDLVASYNSENHAGFPLLNMDIRALGKFVLFSCNGGQASKLKIAIASSSRADSWHWKFASTN